MHDVTHILSKIDGGDDAASDELLPLVYSELRKLAAARLAQERPGQTLQATALVHEAWLRLVGPGNQNWQSRAHFFAAAAEAMRRILVDAARRKGRLKRGGELKRQEVELAELTSDGPGEEVLAVNDALDSLAREHPEKAELVKLRYFGGLTLAEAALALEISAATADRHWKYARAWLAREIREGEG